MAISEDDKALTYEPVTSLLIKTIISAFTFLTALSIRDTVTQSLDLLTPAHSKSKLLVTAFLTMLFLFVTVSLAWQYQNSID